MTAGSGRKSHAAGAEIVLHLRDDVRYYVAMESSYLGSQTFQQKKHEKD